MHDTAVRYWLVNQTEPESCHSHKSTWAPAAANAVKQQLIEKIKGDAALITTHTGCLSGPSVSQVPLSQWGVDGVPVKPRTVCDGRYLPGLQDLLTDPELSIS